MLYKTAWGKPALRREEEEEEEEEEDDDDDDDDGDGLRATPPKECIKDRPSPPIFASRYPSLSPIWPPPTL